MLAALPAMASPPGWLYLTGARTMRLRTRNGVGGERPMREFAEAYGRFAAKVFWPTFLGSLGLYLLSWFF